MKTSIFFLFAVFNFFSYSFSSPDYQPKSENETLSVNPKPENVSCREKNYQIKPETEINSMTPRRLFDELLKINNNSFDTLIQLYDYEDAIEKRIRQAGVDTLSIFTEYANAYEPQNASGCDDDRFAYVLTLAADIDRFEFRLRGTTQGRLTIDAIERAIERKEKTGIKIRREDRTLFLNQIKSTNGVDRAIQDTFWVNRKIEISDGELLEFGNFLIERDLTYPTWSQTDYIKDYSRINKAGNPLQVYIFKKPERFYEVYSEFKKTKP